MEEGEVGGEEGGEGWEEEMVEEGGEGGIEGGGGGSASVRFARGGAVGESSTAGDEWLRFDARSSSIRCAGVGEGRYCGGSDGGGGGGGSSSGGGSGGGLGRVAFAHVLNKMPMRWRIATWKSLSRNLLFSARRELAAFSLPTPHRVESSRWGLGEESCLGW